MEKQKGKEPVIRFPQFKNTWEYKALNEFLYEAKARNGDLKYGKDDVLSVSGELGVVNQIEHLGRSYAGVSVHQYHVVDKGDIVYTKSPLKANPFGIIRINKGSAGIVSTLYAVYKVNAKTAYGPFIDYYFSLDANTNRYLRPLVKKGAKNDMKINNAYVLHDRIYAPIVPEQQKIASFLSAVDEKIKQLTRKKELLEQYKKGVMQQLFSSSELGFAGLEDDRIDANDKKNPTILKSKKSKFRQLRFKDENEKAYPKWEEKTMFDVSENVSYGMNSAAIEYDGKHKYIRITDIDENSGKFNPRPLSSPDGEIEERFKLKQGDIVFARTGASVGKAYLYNPDDGELYYAGFLIKFSIVKANPFFIYCLTQRYEYYKWVHVYSMRSGQPGLNAEEYKALKFNLPILEEQQKIANFLSAIDTKIESVATQIEKTQTFKKGLLQQMFV